MRSQDEIDDLPSDDDMARFGDVTQTCPACGKEVFDDTDLCYHCGHAISTAAGAMGLPARWIIITVGVLVVGFAVALLLRVF